MEPLKTILYENDIRSLKPDFEVLTVISKSLAEKTQTVVYRQDGNTLHVITTNQFPELFHQVVDKLEAKGYQVTTSYTDHNGFQIALGRYGQLAQKEQKEKETYLYRHEANGEEAISLIKETYAKLDSYSEGQFINEILRLSYQAGASDVHFQTEEIGVVMRIRIDGVLQTILIFEPSQFQKYLMKIKYISGVKMNVSHMSQDGRFDFDIIRSGETIKIDVRVSIMPSLRGESIVMRYLDATKGIMTFEDLGCEPFHITELNQQIVENFGLILVTGPTGSGKTTTVYSILNTLNTPGKKIITLEDPVEYELPGVEQVQINEKKGFTFEEGLKGVLRHDPDIIMVGEIRTLKSAEMAVNAALTGHLVVSTIHTNTAVEAITRLLNMGVKPFMLASSINLIIGQRLLRKMVKPRLVEADETTDQDIQEMLITLKTYNPGMNVEYDGNVYQPDKRFNKFSGGYEGRTAVFEMLPISQEIKDAILKNASTYEIQKIAQKHGFLSMKELAYIKMLQGEVSLEEIERVL